jgi:hypothetical protein
MPPPLPCTACDMALASASVELCKMGATLAPASAMPRTFLDREGFEGL